MARRRRRWHKDFDPYVRSATRQGFELVRGRNHDRLRPLRGDLLTIPGTPSDVKGVMNFEHDLEKRGWENDVRSRPNKRRAH